MRIRTMKSSDLDFAAESARLEGWRSETREMFANLLAYQPDGCFIAEENGCRAGLCVGICYRRSGFIGELIVRKEYRGRNIGPLLFKHTVKFVEDQGIQSIFLDGVPKAVPFYESMGFKKICRSLRYLVNPVPEPSSFIFPMTESDIQEVIDLDLPIFGADRSFFIQKRLSRNPHLCKVSKREGRIIGYIQGHEAEDIVCSGPWIIGDEKIDPLSLLRALALDTGGRKIRIGVLETNTPALSAIKKIPDIETQRSAWRMCRGKEDSLGMAGGCYGIGSPAKG